MFNAICDFQLRTRFNLSATRSLCFWSNCWSKLRLRNVVLGITGAAAICFGTKRERDRERLLALGRTGALCAGAPPPPPCFCIIVKRSFNDKTVDPFKWTLPIDDIFFPTFISFFTSVFNYSFEQILSNCFLAIGCTSSSDANWRFFFDFFHNYTGWFTTTTKCKEKRNN